MTRLLSSGAIATVRVSQGRVAIEPEELADFIARRRVRRGPRRDDGPVSATGPTVETFADAGGEVESRA
jgi:hypothetical protein